jgi:hypothetical protein
MLFKAISASVYGIDAHLVQVEVDVGTGRMEDFNVVGLPDNAVKESRQRVKSALRNCGFEFPGDFFQFVNEDPSANGILISEVAAPEGLIDDGELTPVIDFGGCEETAVKKLHSEDRKVVLADHLDKAAPLIGVGFP